VWY